MDQALVQGHRIQQRLEGGTGRTPGPHHVHMAGAAAIAELQRADIRTCLQAAVVHHQQGRRGTFGQVGKIAFQTLLQRPLQVGVDGGVNALRLRLLPVQALGQQRRLQRWLQAAGDHDLLLRLGHHRCGPDPLRLHARQHLVAGALRCLRVTVRAQPAGCLRQHRQQGRLGMRERTGRLAQVSPAGRLHALDGAAERCPFQVQGEDLTLVQVGFQLQRAQHLAQLAGDGAGVRFEQAGHLHGQGRAPGNDPALPQPLPGSTQQGPRVDAGVAMEVPVLVGQQGLQVQRGHRIRVGRVTPHPLVIGKGTQWRAIGGDHQGGGVTLPRQGQRKQLVQHQQGQQHGHRSPAQYRQQSLPPLPPASAGVRPGRCPGVHQGWTTSMLAGSARPTPRSCGRYMSSTSGGGTWYCPGLTARTR